MVTRISIIVPVFNNADRLSCCLDSFWQQGLSDDEFEVILVNDCSTDNSISVIEPYLKCHSNIKLINQTRNQGVSISRNVGINHSVGNYIMFVDADDFLYPNVLSPLIKKAEKQDLDILCGCMVEVYDDCSFEIKEPQFIEYDKVYNNQSYLLSGVDIDSACSKLISRKLLQKYTLRFNEALSFGEDSLFIGTAFACSTRISYSKVLLYSYILHNSSATHILDYAHRIKKINDSIILANCLKEVPIEFSLYPKLKTYFFRWAYTTICSTIIVILKDRLLNNIEFLDYQRQLVRDSLYPIKLPLLHWKVSLLAFFINIPYVLKLLGNIRLK